MAISVRLLAQLYIYMKKLFVTNCLTEVVFDNIQITHILLDWMKTLKVTKIKLDH